MRTVIETITPEIAAAYLLRNKSNRPVSKRHVEQLSKAIKAGKFGVTHQGIAFDDQGNLIDGQHRLHAIVKSGKAVRISVSYGVLDESKISIDTGMRVRSYSDALTIQGDKLATKTVVATCRMRMLLEGNIRPALFEVSEFLDKHREPIARAIVLSAGNKILSHACFLAMVSLAIERGHEDEIGDWAESVRTGIAREDWQTSATRLREWWVSAHKNGGSNERVEYCKKIYTSMLAWMQRRKLSRLCTKETIEWLSQ